MLELLMVLREHAINDEFGTHRFGGWSLHPHRALITIVHRNVSNFAPRCFTTAGTRLTQSVFLRVLLLYFFESFMTHVCAVYSPLCLIRGTRDRNGAPLHEAPIGAGAARANGNTAPNVRLRPACLRHAVRTILRPDPAVACCGCCCGCCDCCFYGWIATGWGVWWCQLFSKNSLSISSCIFHFSHKLV